MKDINQPIEQSIIQRRLAAAAGAIAADGPAATEPDSAEAPSSRAVDHPSASVRLRAQGSGLSPPSRDLFCLGPALTLSIPEGVDGCLLGRCSLLAS